MENKEGSESFLLGLHMRLHWTLDLLHHYHFENSKVDQPSESLTRQ